MARFAGPAVSLLCLFALGGAGPADSRRVAPGPLDGAATPDACSRFGFAPAAEDNIAVDARSRRGSAGAVLGKSAPSPRAAPPPSVAMMAPAPPPMPFPSASPAQAFAQDRDTERYPEPATNPIRTTAQAPVSTFSIDVDTAAYANVRRFLNDGQRPPRDAVRVEELVNYFDYGYARPVSAQDPFKAQVAVVPSPWGAGKQIVHIGLQGYAAPAAAQPPLNLVFLVDVSGSMWSEDRLPLAKKALNLLVDELRPQDRVSMVVYAGAAGAVLEPTDGRQKLKIRCALGALKSGGSTAGGEGLALAYAMAQQNFDKAAVNRVILMTDGDFNVGVTGDRKLEDFVADKRKTGVYLSVYGFGRGNYNDRMMQTISQAGNGTAAYIDSLNEARKLFRDDFSGSLFPIADDVKIQVEFNPARVAEYRLVGYETRMLKREDFNNDQVDAGEVGSGASVTALYEITPVGGPLSSDPLRYGAASPKAQGVGELGFLKIRYKSPGGSASKLIQQPIGADDAYASLAAAPEATRWAVAVASYGQKLRGDAYVPGSYGWSQIGDLAQGARGADVFGLRAEFVQLVRAASTAKSINE